MLVLELKLLMVTFYIVKRNKRTEKILKPVRKYCKFHPNIVVEHDPNCTKNSRLTLHFPTNYTSDLQTEKRRENFYFFVKKNFKFSKTEHKNKNKTK